MVTTQKTNYKDGIEFSDYGATIVSQLSLRFLRGRSIRNLSFRLSRSSKT